MSEDADACPICIEPIQCGDVEAAASSACNVDEAAIMTTTCGHNFHRPCLQHWIQQKNRCCTCMLCCGPMNVVFFDCPICRGKQVAIGERWIMSRSKMDWYVVAIVRTRDWCIFGGGIMVLVLLYFLVLLLAYAASQASNSIIHGGAGNDLDTELYLIDASP